MPRLDPHSCADTSQGRIEHIDFDLHVRMDERVITGVARYRLDRDSPGIIDFDTHRLVIDSVRADRLDVHWDLGAEQAILGQRLRIEGLVGAREFTIAFRCAEDAKALQWLNAEQTASGRHPFLYSQCQSINARSLFPCQDTPSVRFTFSASVRVNQPLRVVMAAAPGETGRDQDGEYHRFEMPQPIPSYLFALAVGEIVSQDVGPRCRVYAEPALIDAAAWEFGEMEAMLAIGEDLFGPYRWDRYDVLVLPRSFPYSGMENPRLTFLNPVLMTGDRSETDTLAHELAHSWTGNLVTNATWEDFWLNEGWTSYAEARITAQLSGQERALLLNVTKSRQLREDVARYGADSKLTCLKFSQEGIDPEEAFSRIPYFKGQFFIEMLERAVGRQAFDRFIHEYIQTYAFQSITTEAFLEFLGRRLPQAAAQVPIDEWIYQPGIPASLPEFSSRSYDQVAKTVADYQAGRLPTRADVEGWTPRQRELFLLLMPERIPAADVRALDETLNFRSVVSYVTLSYFYRLAIFSDYQDILPRARKFVLDTGPLLSMERVVRALADTEWSRPHARPLFEEVRPRLHPVTAARLARELDKAGA